jgi:hypothetical protein
VAYEAFAATMTEKHASWGMPAFADRLPAPDYQDAWEAAAQAVLEAFLSSAQRLTTTPPQEEPHGA